MMKGFKSLWKYVEGKPGRDLCLPEETDPYHLYSILLEIKGRKENTIDRELGLLCMFNFDKKEQERTMGVVRVNRFRYNNNSLLSTYYTMFAWECMLIIINVHHKQIVDIHAFFDQYANNTVADFNKYTRVQPEVNKDIGTQQNVNGYNKDNVTPREQIMTRLQARIQALKDKQA